ncbi:MAG: energy transducer TonB [Candidatus Omnitrophica bacterium]|nr:energy transducer TonB [Candidatus Omnitrophota bacterium]
MSVENKIFLACLSISSLLHISVIGFPAALLNNTAPARQPVEIVYMKKPPPSAFLPEKKEKKSSSVRETSVVNRAVLDTGSVLDKKMSVPAYLERLRNIDRPLRPHMFKPQAVSAKKKVTLPPAVLPPEGIGNPTYQGYYAGVREKIRRAAYENYRHAAQGGVFVSFIVSRNGSLRAVKVLDERSTASNYLRETASRSVVNAAPFARFPRELDYDELTFNVMISFEIE